VLVWVAAVVLSGCADQPRSRSASPNSPSSGIVALIAGEPIRADRLQRDLIERSGAWALSDLILDELLDRELDARGLNITQADIEAEEARFVRSGAGEADGVSPYVLLNRIRATNGLGADRYPRLLRRTAILRILVAMEAVPSEQEYELAQAIAFGPQYRVRLFVSPDRSAATALRNEVLAAQSSTPNSARWIFADACTVGSVHPSSARGGLIERISPDDPAYPPVLSQAVRDTPAMGISPVLAGDSGFMLAMVESITPAVEPTPEQMKSVRDQLTLRKEQAAMERLANQLIRESEIIVMDRALNKAWNDARTTEDIRP
tara:strand:- start:85281 stop:86237 length:957 start_codon:yes stop_codon:yes gene_type:complete